MLALQQAGTVARVCPAFSLCDGRDKRKTNGWINTCTTGTLYIPLLFPRSLFAAAAPHPVSWDETPHPQVPGEDPGPAYSVFKVTVKSLMIIN